VAELSYTKVMYIRAVIGIVIVATLALVAFFFWPTQDTSKDAAPVDNPTPIQTEEKNIVTHTFREGTHAIAGMVTLPTPCHELQENITVAESFPEQVHIDLVIAATDGICIQVLDEREFSIDVDVDEAATFTLSIDGVTVPVPALISTDI